MLAPTGVKLLKLSRDSDVKAHDGDGTVPAEVMSQDIASVFDLGPSECLSRPPAYPSTAEVKFDFDAIPFFPAKICSSSLRSTCNSLPVNITAAGEG